LRLVLAVDQITRSLGELLVPAGCTRLTIRAGFEQPAFDERVTRSLKDLAQRGSIVLVCPVRPLDEAPSGAARRVAALMRTTLAQSVHVILHTQSELPPACSELGRLAGQGHTALHFGISQRDNPEVRTWGREFARAFGAETIAPEAPQEVETT
jgi:hypothetical protein